MGKRILSILIPLIWGITICVVLGIVARYTDLKPEYIRFEIPIDRLMKMGDVQVEEETSILEFTEVGGINARFFIWRKDLIFHADGHDDSQKKQEKIQEIMKEWMDDQGWNEIEWHFYNPCARSIHIPESQFFGDDDVQIFVQDVTRSEFLEPEVCIVSALLQESNEEYVKISISTANPSWYSIWLWW
ncbi:MAG: hypothetical protein ACE5RO_06865 [Candidatus Nitrosomaritimum yanchengensis]